MRDAAADAARLSRFGKVDSFAQRRQGDAIDAAARATITFRADALRAHAAYASKTRRDASPCRHYASF